VGSALGAVTLDVLLLAAVTPALIMTALGWALAGHSSPLLAASCGL